MILVMFTASYPFDVAIEQTFLDNEMEHLAANFEQVFLIPRKCEGTKLPVPRNVEVIEEYSSYLESASKSMEAARALFSPFLYHDLFVHPWVVFHLPSLIRLVSFLAGARLTKQWVQAWLEKKGVHAADCIFYTYWFDQAAMGIGLAKAHYPDLRLVSRIHGYDLYEERYFPPYLPCRPAAFEVVDGVYADAEAGLAYLKKRYPDFSSRFEVHLIGVRNPGFICSPSSDGVFRIVSCSIIRPVKRLELLLEGFAAAARQRPHQRFEWHHFGNGESEKTKYELQQSARETLPDNARAFFPGYSTQQALMDFYRENPIDVFLNVSSSEGTPVSTMEAISCGIPIIATGVGGNCEIVTAQNGILLPPHPSADEIAEAIFKLLDDPETAHGKREGSLAIWHSKYDADTNFRRFAGRLKNIRDAGRVK